MSAADRQANPRYWRCTFGFHPWSRWSGPRRASGQRVETWSIGSRVEREHVPVVIVAQDRTCEGCGLWQQRLTEIVRREGASDVL